MISSMAERRAAVEPTSKRPGHWLQPKRRRSSFRPGLLGTVSGPHSGPYDGGVCRRYRCADRSAATATMMIKASKLTGGTERPLSSPQRYFCRRHPSSPLPNGLLVKGLRSSRQSRSRGADRGLHGRRVDKRSASTARPVGRCASLIRSTIVHVAYAWILSCPAPAFRDEHSEAVGLCAGSGYARAKVRYGERRATR